MIRSYLQIAFRNLIRHKLYAIINMFGLATGLALALIIVGHISYELSFESIHPNRDRIYRVVGSYASEDTEFQSAQVMAPLGDALTSELGEIDHAADFRVMPLNRLKIGEGETRPIKDKYENQAYVHGIDVFFATPEFFEVFNYPLMKGRPEALHEPSTAFVTEKAVREYFDGQDPVGQMVTINDTLEFQVRGVLKEIPQNTQIYFDFLVSYVSLERAGVNTRSWDQFGEDYLYVLLNPRARSAEIEAKIPAILDNHLGPEQSRKYQISLQPLDKIYFGSMLSGRRGELRPRGEISVIMAFAFIAAFVLIQAIANYINLETARSAQRMKEVGVRKVLGAFPQQLVRQYLSESIAITLCATAIGLVLYELFKAGVSLYPRDWLVDFYYSPGMCAAVLALILGVGFCAGFYPALHLSRFNPLAILQRKMGIKSRRSRLRKALVTFQFGLAIVFIISTLTFYRQFNHIQGIHLGFNTQDVILLDFTGKDAARNCQLMKEGIIGSGLPASVTASGNPPGRASYESYGFYTDPECRRENQIVVRLYHTDYDFLPTYGLQMVQGKWFDPELTGKVANPIIINESTVRSLKISNPIGHQIYRRSGTYEVVGVVKDFQGTSLDILYESYSFIMIKPEKCRTLSIKIPSNTTAASIKKLEEVWRRTLPGEQFSYTFLEDEVAASYSDLRGQMKIFLTLSLLTIGIACLGILGLVAFAAEQKTKEIGIRKVLGATVSRIVSLLSKEFVIPIVIANALAWPTAFFIMRSFLQGFPFRVSMGAGTFLLSGGLALLLALLTAAFKAVRAATANPVDSLRYE